MSPIFGRFFQCTGIRHGTKWWLCHRRDWKIPVCLSRGACTVDYPRVWWHHNQTRCHLVHCHRLHGHLSFCPKNCSTTPPRTLSRFATFFSVRAEKKYGYCNGESAVRFDAPPPKFVKQIKMGREYILISQEPLYTCNLCGNTGHVSSNAPTKEIGPSTKKSTAPLKAPRDLTRHRTWRSRNMGRPRTMMNMMIMRRRMRQRRTLMMMAMNMTMVIWGMKDKMCQKMRVLLHCTSESIKVPLWNLWELLSLWGHHRFGNEANRNNRWFFPSPTLLLIIRLYDATPIRECWGRRRYWEAKWSHIYLQNKIDIARLCESHMTEEKVARYQQRWQTFRWFSNCHSPNSCGVTFVILRPNRIPIDSCKFIKKDSHGRQLGLQMKVDSAKKKKKRVRILGLYTPNGESDSVASFNGLHAPEETRYHIMLGDFNRCQDSHDRNRSRCEYLGVRCDGLTVQTVRRHPGGTIIKVWGEVQGPRSVSWPISLPTASQHTSNHQGIYQIGLTSRSASY